jgi:hypothetical protein
VAASGSARVAAYDSARVAASGSARVEAYGSARVEAYDSARVAASGSASVEAYDSARVAASGSARVAAYDSARVAASGYVAVQIKHTHTGTVQGGVQINVPDLNRDAATWAAARLAPAVDGRVTVYKAVNSELVSGHGTKYPIGEEVGCPDFRAESRCGNGLHFSPRPFMAKRYQYGSDTRFLECTIAADTLVPLGDDKCKAPSCIVVREVTMFCDEVAPASEAAA